MGFAASLNYERRIPNWVLEHLPGIGPEGGDVSEATRDGMKFFADKTVPALFRVLPNDYIGLDDKGEACTRGLSRGHLAAAQFHKRTTEELAETFNMNANTVPQDMTMNAVDWMRLESLTKKLRRHYENGLWIVTGPVFHPRFVDGDARAWRWAEWPQRPAALKPAEYATLNGDEVRHQGSAGEMRKRHKVVCYEVVGRHNVAVPTHLFKVVLGERADGSHEVAAFLMPNEPITVEKPLVTYQVPVAHVEWLTGLEFFRQALNNDVSRQRTLQGIDNLPNICKRLTCEARVGGMFQVYRDVARLRAAGSLSELQKVYNAFLTEQQNRCDGTANKVVTLNEVVAHEYRERMKELVGRREDGIG
ncbi:unnamed protein product [Trypanosoma congolense IL3000]|uniref:WGS project CAEQ00000000 data, annotated contig 255 n=1 Tax=Trypanosoma congolense (strain IL3000) TaxID=1068625 RepID=F9WEE2_TRYCI|nr:unnamed protein product [Trypanosoma congolense IL3000]